jgi:hypothetical protein
MTILEIQRCKGCLFHEKLFDDLFCCRLTNLVRRVKEEIPHNCPLKYDSVLIRIK